MRKTVVVLTLLLLVTVSLSGAPGGPRWLRDAVIYQVYPSSYKDSDGDGIGDIRGVIGKLGYIQSLGVTAVWFNPLFESAWADGGYDIIDFYKVDPRFGTNDDLVELVEEAHKRGLKVILDLVAGHTSDRCPWFLQSAQGTNMRYSDYYIWSDRLPDEKAEQEYSLMMQDPNYKQSNIGKWMKSDYPRNRFYCKNFYASQPALNFGYANPDPSRPWEQGVDAPGPRAVRQELKNILAFWFDKGVDGFRVDMANSLVKDDPGKKETIRLWQEIRMWMDVEYPERALISEWSRPERSLTAGFNADMLLLSLNSPGRLMTCGPVWQADGCGYFSLDGCRTCTKDLYGRPVPQEKIEEGSALAVLEKYYNWWERNRPWTDSLGYCASITGNHDNLRINCGDRCDPAQLKVVLAWVLTMHLPILYYGDEIGLRSLVGMPDREGANLSYKERSGGRTPMQWDGSENAGFSTCRSEDIYLPVCPEWTAAKTRQQYLEWKASGAKNPTALGTISVADEDEDPGSLLNWTRSLIALRKAHPAFWADASFEPVFDRVNAYPMVYRRSDGTETWIVALNPTGKPCTLTFPQEGRGTVPAVLSSGKATLRISSGKATLKMNPVSVYITRL